MSAARDAILSELGMTMNQRLKPQVASTQVITSVEPHQAQLLNKWASGSLLVPGQTLGVIECTPAAYISMLPMKQKNPLKLISLRCGR
ncbi:MAG: hypothetical protein Ct9H300mP14_17040 [Gammaproteobacteria bacterium]|nr:MAG: hypothetical protein Ct9H300mP14_17040 [Gammaproteobacteria bacterium]